MEDPNHSVVMEVVESTVPTALAAIARTTDRPVNESTSRAVERRLSPLEIDAATFRSTFGMRRDSFDWLCGFLERQWLGVHRSMDVDDRVQLQDRVAIAVFYLTHWKTLKETAETFQVTSTDAKRYVWQVVDILLSSSVKWQYFNFPKTDEGWRQLCDEFQAICGYPNCCLAIGSMLVEIERPRGREGWYCNKHFYAENVQLVVDAQCRVQSMEVQRGGMTDRKSLMFSWFGRGLDETIPEGKHDVGHAGYALSKYVVVPYQVTKDMTPAERLFNRLQMTNQRVVKQTSEMIKKRFRILQSPLRPKTEDGDPAMWHMPRIVSAAIVLHNILVDLNDLVEVDYSLVDDTDEEETDEDSDSEDSDLYESTDDDATAQRDQIKEHLYANRGHILKRFG